MTLSESLWVFEATYTQFGHVPLTSLPSNLKVSQFWVGPKIKRLCNLPRMLYKLFCHLSPMKKIQWCFMCWWQIRIPYGIFCRPLLCKSIRLPTFRILKQAIPSSVVNSSIGKQLLACYRLGNCLLLALKNIIPFSLIFFKKSLSNLFFLL